MGKIADLKFGYVGTYDDNEVEIVSTMKDPPKIRLTVDEDKVESNLGAVSFNVRRADGRHEEVAYCMGRLTGNTKRMGAMYLATRGPNDQQSIERMYIDHTVALFHVPVMAPNLGGVGPDTFAAGVVALYRELLFRDPEGDVIERVWRPYAVGDLNKVRQGIISSSEYKVKHPA